MSSSARAWRQASVSEASVSEAPDRPWEYYLPDFSYVVREQTKARVAFGSAQSRSVMPLAGLRGGASRLANLEVRATDGLDQLGPAAYCTDNLGALYDVLNRVTSIRGVGPGARTAARFKDTDDHLPAPNAYQPVDCSGHLAASNKTPFNTTTARKPLTVSNTPGPGSYSPGAFALPGVPVSVRCGAGEAPGNCELCLRDLVPGVEFWALDASVSVQGMPKGSLICEACMVAARKPPPGHNMARFTRWQLDAFKKSRDCSDIHRHEGTRAKILLVDPKTVSKRRRREAYLAKYFRDHTVRDPNLTPGTEPAMLTEADEPFSRVRRDDFCCLHEAFNSFNRDKMSFGLRIPSDLIYNTMKKCALDFQPSASPSSAPSWPSDSASKTSKNSVVQDGARQAALTDLPRGQ